MTAETVEVMSENYAYASFSEVVNDYWTVLGEFGFTATMESVSQETVMSSFENGEGTLEAAFTFQGYDVAVTLTWV